MRIVLPADEPEQASEEQTKDVQNIVQSLVGSIPHTDHLILSAGLD